MVKKSTPNHVAFSNLEAQFVAAESKLRGSSMGGYDLDAGTLRPGKVSGATGGSAPQTEFAGKSKVKFEPNDAGYEFVEPEMND